MTNAEKIETINQSFATLKESLKGADEEVLTVLVIEMLTLQDEISGLIGGQNAIG